MSSPKLPPGPSIFSHIGKRPRPFLDNLVDLLHTYGDLVKMPMLTPTFLVNHVDAIHEILVERPLEFTKKNREYRRLAKFFGNGLLTSYDKSWKERRRLIQPIFHRQILADSAPRVVAATHTMLANWQLQYIKPAKIFNLTQEMLNLVLTISGSLLFSQDLTPQIKIITGWVSKSHRAAATALVLNRFLPTFYSVQFYSGLTQLERFAKRLIEQRKQCDDVPPDLLTLLINSQKGTPSGLTDEAIIDEIKTFLVTGYETVGYALTWTWWHLSSYPDVFAKVKQEVDTVLGERLATAEDVGRLTYLRQVIQETMRLYPPIWMFARKNDVPLNVKNYQIPPKSTLGVCAYTLHRHPLYWPNAEKFDPDRFSAENSASRPKLAYLPFGAGPRVCIAGSSAMLHMPLILATMLQHIVIENKTKRALKPIPLVSLKPHKALMVKASNCY